MLRSMFSAIAGLRNHQNYMDVVGNNISNVNTTAFKGSRVAFQDILYQTIRGASGPAENRGGINPAQIGLGSMVAGVDTINSQGNLQSTGRITDFAIQGEGYFILGEGARSYYTRDGAFDLGTDGSLLNPNSGMKVRGWAADTAGAIDTNQAPGYITIPMGNAMAARPTAAAAITGNLDARSAVGSTFRTNMEVYDSLGTIHNITVTYTKTANNAWTWQASATDGTTITSNPAQPVAVTFDGTGRWAAGNPAATMSFTFTNGAAALNNLPATMTAITQFSRDGELSTISDGYAAGSLVSFTVGNSGDINGVYSNGQSLRVGRIAMARFANAGGLSHMGGNMWESTAASGNAQVGTPNTSGRGSVANGFLEMSNVDLAQQFTNMIVAERGFQANSRIISASDEMLQDLVNLKR